MKAKELIIGDNVLVNNIPRKVCAITKKKIGFHLEAHETVMHYARLVEVSPVPLTPEILEKNGFEKRYSVLYLWTNLRTRQHIEIQDWQRKEGTNNWAIRVDGKLTIDINYIHELQHALRLCGLNELADNFKI